MDRRKFIRGGGAVGGLFAGLLAGKAVVERIHTKEIIVEKMLPAPVDVAEQAMEPVGITMLTLTGNSKPPEAPKDTNGYTFAPINPQHDLQVGMAVGRDKRLWIKVDQEWKRVALDPLDTDV